MTPPQCVKKIKIYIYLKHISQFTQTTLCIGEGCRGRKRERVSKSNSYLFIFYFLADTRSNGDTRSRHYTSQMPAGGPTRDIIHESWIFALCMRCRVEYNTPSWEPPHWQKVCPFPLCPSYRQFANVLSIILIGECENINSTGGKRRVPKVRK